MKITQVEYSATINLGNYQSAKIGLVASVNEGEQPANILEALKDWVAKEAAKLPVKAGK